MATPTIQKPPQGQTDEPQGQVFICFRRPEKVPTVRVKTEFIALWIGLGWEEFRREKLVVVLRWVHAGEPRRPTPSPCSSCKGRRSCPACWDLQPWQSRSCKDCAGSRSCKSCGGRGYASRKSEPTSTVVEYPF
jgi:hypothetical protein